MWFYFNEIIFSGIFPSIKKTAPTIQEIYDCDVLHIPWNEFKVGKISRESIFKASSY
ncbi:hypothetical protein LGZ99_20635 [Photorhabdus temperata]|uniref:S-4TM family putative pore-forming effector n=1 Tax=Photorhabdus TaxID=29487 RepID=UPI00140D0659|nr:S-4TM family putative pore-forming effector [Photorhabdus temperata]MCT8349536.1 hypothetical protein [Photorhabdus temperata]